MKGAIDVAFFANFNHYSIGTYVQKKIKRITEWPIEKIITSAASPEASHECFPIQSQPNRLILQSFSGLA